MKRKLYGILARLLDELLVAWKRGGIEAGDWRALMDHWEEVREMEHAETPDRRKTFPLDVGCPSCGAAAGRLCRTSTGNRIQRTLSHIARERAAQIAEADDGP